MSCWASWPLRSLLSWAFYLYDIGNNASKGFLPTVFFFCWVLKKYLHDIKLWMNMTINMTNQDIVFVRTNFKYFGNISCFSFTQLKFREPSPSVKPQYNLSSPFKGISERGSWPAFLCYHNIPRDLPFSSWLLITVWFTLVLPLLPLINLASTAIF